MPQRGYDLQPRVAASATLGISRKNISTATRLSRLPQRELHQQTQPRCGCGQDFFFTQGSRSGNLGLEAVAPLGHR